jgi:hypothetical protein
MDALSTGGDSTLSDGTVVTAEGLTLDLEGGKGRPGLWEQKRELKAGAPE